jgi:signal transduction histidine kinase
MSLDTMPNQRTQEILWALPDPLMALSSSLRVEYMNSALEKMLGFSLGQVKGKTIHEVELEAGEEWKTLIQKLENFSNGNSGRDKEIGAKKSTVDLLADPLMPQVSSGPYQDRPKISMDERVYSYEIYKVSDPKELNPLSAVLFREITKDIEISDQMAQAEKMSGLGTLAAGLAHELNNPLYTIIGFSEMILKESDKAKADLIAKRIGERSKELVAILENFSRHIQSNPIDGHMTVNINERLDAALGIALMAHESKNITIHKNYSPLPFFKARSDEIEQIFFGIFLNSIQAMRGNGDLEICSTSIDKGKGIVVTIRDTGEGVPKEYIAKVFDPFFTTKDQGEGTGLGLTAAYQLVKKYGGRIKFNSVQGQGTTVEIYWPVENGAGFQQ